MEVRPIKKAETSS